MCHHRRSQQSQIVDLGTLGGSGSSAMAINNSGQIAGSAGTASGSSAFLWQNGHMTSLGTLGGTACAINDSGQIVGWSYGTGDSGHAFLWQSGTLTALAGLTGYPYSWACGINHSGQIAGYAGNESIIYHAVLWQSGSPTDLGTMGGSWGASACGINDSGQIVGTASIPGGEYTHAFLWQNDSMSDLGTFGGYNSYAVGINSSGEIAGWAEDPCNNPVACLWQDGAMTDLGTLGGRYYYSYALSINSSGQIVGYAQTDGDTSERALLWQNGTMIDLGTLPGGGSSRAQCINDNGWIVGSAVDSSGVESHAVLWMPTGGPPDTTPPTVAITNPTSSATYSTSASAINISGTASDNVDVVSVSWSDNRGGSGSCSGTTTWSETGIALQPGANIITISAQDGAGNIGTATLTVTTTDNTPPGSSADVVTGNVSANGASVVGAMVTFYPRYDFGYTLTDASGNYTISNWPLGVTEMTAYQSAYGEIIKTVTIVSGVNTVDFAWWNKVPMKLGQLKALADTTAVQVLSPVTVAVNSGLLGPNVTYVEESDRTCGIKVVLPPGQSVNAGNRITLTGTLTSDANGERYIQCSTINSNDNGTTAPKAVGVVNKGVANLVGTLVKVWGGVTPGSGFVTLNDGGLSPGTSGITVSTAGITKTIGSFLSVTGIVGKTTGGKLIVQPRGNADVD